MSSFKWSTPERRAGQKMLPLISNEIYLDIFDYIQFSEDITERERKDALSRLALVCRFFCALAIPIVFRSLNFSPDCQDRPKHRFCREVVKNQEAARSLALYVKSCTFCNWMPSAIRPQLIVSTFLGFYIRVATRFDNLEKLCLYSTPIDRNLIKSFGKFNKLTSLSINDCSLDNGVVVGDFSGHLSSLHLVTLEVMGLSWPEQSLAALSNLAHSPSLRALQTDSTFARVFMNSNTNVFLEELGVRTPTLGSVSVLRDFLIRTSSITKLSIYLSKFPYLNLPSSALPNLRILRCAPRMGCQLIPHRPLETVDLCYSEGTHINTLEDDSPDHHNTLGPALALSTSIVRTLKLPSKIYLAMPAIDQLNQLHTLCLDWGKGHPIQLEAFDEFRQHIKTPPIRELVLTSSDIPTLAPSWSLDLKTQHAAVADILAARFPTVLRVRISNIVEWERPDDRSKEWQPFICGISRHYVRSTIQARLTDKGITDYRSCLSSMFETSEIDGLPCLKDQ